ncbi:MAG: hypothetical protein QNJ32_00580 [Xenococcaceae cyanobacterium MO_167.B27]|nr:hypothetical protein [Xenococcaceae cyanobacterium MO_167.B27]
MNFQEDVVSKIGNLTVLNMGEIIANIDSREISLVTGGDGEDIILLLPTLGDNFVSSGAGDDILVGNGGDDTLNGGEGDDLIASLSGNDSLSGGRGNDTLTGGGVSFTNDLLLVTVDTSGIDTLTGGEGEDLFVLGGRSSTISKEAETDIIYYDEAGNKDYALITDFNKIEDTINLGGATSDYHLGSSRNDLPAGTALYQDGELIAIIQGSSQLSLEDSYFQGN